MKKYDSIQDTMKHKEWVLTILHYVLQRIESRGIYHDQSKLIDPEKELFDKWGPKLAGLTYGSPEYKKVLKGLGPALDHHYKFNAHHPEHFKNGIKEMNLIDLIEMLVDWIAATKRHNDGDIFRSIKVNKERFGYSDDLEAIFRNTAMILKDIKI